MNSPRVTVLMSVHNAARWLREAMESVLAQTFCDFEFLILDDASTDASVAVIESFGDVRIRLIRLPENIGLTRSLNVGLREARGEFVARQDGDDLSAPERLARQVAFLDAHPEVAVVGAQGRLIDAEGRSRGNRDLPLEPASVRWLSLFDNPVMHTAAMFRVAVAHEEFGGYDETFATCQDYDLWTRIMGRHEVRNLPERLVTVREHGGSISATRRAEGVAMVRRVVERIADRAGLNLEDVEMALAFRRHVTLGEVAAWRASLPRWDAKFAEDDRHGPAATDLRRTKAGVRARVGYNLLTANRGAGVGELIEAVRGYPPLMTELPWLRIAALLVLGTRVRAWFTES